MKTNLLANVQVCKTRRFTRALPGLAALRNTFALPRTKCRLNIEAGDERVMEAQGSGSWEGDHGHGGPWNGLLKKKGDWHLRLVKTGDPTNGLVLAVSSSQGARAYQFNLILHKPPKIFTLKKGDAEPTIIQLVTKYAGRAEKRTVR